MAKANRSWLKLIAHGKRKSTKCFSDNFTQQRVHQFSLVFVYKFLFAILQFAEEFLVSVDVNVQYNNNIDQKKPVSRIFTPNLEMKSPRGCVRVRFYI